MLTKCRAVFAHFVGIAQDERGATATEYALLVGVIALVIVAGVVFFGDNLNTWFNRLGEKVQSANS